MRKYLSLALALLLIFSIATSTAFASGIEGYSTSRDYCSHASAHLVTHTERIPYNNSNTTHKVEVTQYYQCNNCKQNFDDTVIDSYFESHACSAWTYTGSNHSGNPAKHYCTYSGHCSLCGQYLRNTMSTGCTEDICYNPQK